jgi:hypothetical protein
MKIAYKGSLYGVQDTSCRAMSKRNLEIDGFADGILMASRDNPVSIYVGIMIGRQPVWPTARSCDPYSALPAARPYTLDRDQWYHLLT